MIKKKFYKKLLTLSILTSAALVPTISVLAVPEVVSGDCLEHTCQNLYGDYMVAYSGQIGLANRPLTNVRRIWPEDTLIMLENIGMRLVRETYEQQEVAIRQQRLAENIRKQEIYNQKVAQFNSLEEEAEIFQRQSEIKNVQTRGQKCAKEEKKTAEHQEALIDYKESLSQLEELNSKINETEIRNNEFTVLENEIAELEQECMELNAEFENLEKEI